MVAKHSVSKEVERDEEISLFMLMYAALPLPAVFLWKTHPLKRVEEREEEEEE